MLLYQILPCTIHGEIQKIHTNTINLKYRLQQEIKGLSFLMDYILYQIFKTVSSISTKT